VKKLQQIMKPELAKTIAGSGFVFRDRLPPPASRFPQQ